MLKTLFIFLFIPIQTFSQATSFVWHESKNNNYKMQIESKCHIYSDTTNGGYQDFYTFLNSDSTVKYLVNVIRVRSNFDFEYLCSSEYKNKFISDSLKVIAVDEKNYPNFNGIRFTRILKLSNEMFFSYSISTIINNGLYVITYNTIEENFYKYESEFEFSVNSIIFKY